MKFQIELFKTIKAKTKTKIPDKVIIKIWYTHPHYCFNLIYSGFRPMKFISLSGFFFSRNFNI